MSDSMSYMTLERATNGQAADPNATTNGYIISDSPPVFLDRLGNHFSTPQQIPPGTAPPDRIAGSVADKDTGPWFYKLTGITAGGFTVPYNVVQGPISGGSRNYFLGFGGTSNEQIGSGVNNIASAVTKTADGGVVFCAYFTSPTITLGSQTITLSGAGGQDLLLAKLDSAGNVVWAKSFGKAGAGNAILPVSIAVSPVDGAVAVGGYFNGTENFGGSDHASSYSYDAFIAKYDSSGNWVWDKEYGSASTGRGFDSVSGLVFTATGDVVACGFFQGNNIDFGAGAQYNGADGYDSFLIKISGSVGALIWSRVFACGGDNEANAVALDSSGNIVVVGNGGIVNPSNNTGVYLSPPYPPNTLFAPGGTGSYVAKFATDGTYIWGVMFGGSVNGKAVGVAINPTDSTNAIFVASIFRGSITIAGGTANSVSPFGDICLVKLSSLGAAIWAKTLPGGNFVGVTSIAVDSSSNPSITGWFDHDINFGNGSVNSSAPFQNTAYIAKYSGNVTGFQPVNYLWAQVIIGAGGNNGFGVTTDTFNNVIGIGTFFVNATAANQTIVSNGSTDLYLLKVSP